MSKAAQQARIDSALTKASDTRVLRLGCGVIAQAADIFRTCFGAAQAIIIADTNTFAAAGRKVADVLAGAGIDCAEPEVFDDPDLHAYYRHVGTLERRLSGTTAIPLAVGSGTINDLTKLAAHHCNRPYMAVATAASMDGYTAFGASINHQGSKQTFFCPAPVAVIADLDVISAAPGELNAAGYGDLVAKVAAGADWLVADALGCEPIDPQAWSMVQEPLREWIARPGAIRSGDFDALAGLVEGLLMTGFAMQWSKSSRPASGAEHQFSHLWDMQDHHHQGRIPYHGYKVSIGTLASIRLYEELMNCGLERLDVQQAVTTWPEANEIEEMVSSLHELADVRAVALKELQAKHISRDELCARLERLKSAWPDLHQRLRQQLLSADGLAQMLADAGAPSLPAQIGIDSARLQRSYGQAQQIRRRYTVLDLAVETGLMDRCLKSLFAPQGAWSRAMGEPR